MQLKEANGSASGSLASSSHRSQGWAWLSGAIIAEVTGSLSLRGATTTPLLYALTGAAFLLAFWFLTRTLKTGFGLGVAYGVWGAAGVALTALGSTLIFAEPFTPQMAVGVALIIGGVLAIEFGSRARAKLGGTQ